jgi:hypothetical protein
MEDIIVTLTTIPPRFKYLSARIDAILSQSVKPSKIEIYVPKTYRRFPGQRVSLPRFTGVVDVVAVDEDLGPATKLLPALRRWRGESVNLIICDDDRMHDKNWIARLFSVKQQRPNDIVCERGWFLHERSLCLQPVTAAPMAQHAPGGGRNWRYRLLRGLSGGALHPPRRIYRTPGYVDVFEGFLGVILKPADLPADAGPLPPWAYYHDDLWFSGLARLHGKGIWVHDLPHPIFSDRRADKVFALKHDASFETRANLEKEGVAWFQRNHQIW